MDYVIIGAGLTGLHIAQALENRNQTYTILEKSKGLGGRVATRRIDDLGLDHGALFLESIDLNLPLKAFSTVLGNYVPGGMNQIAKFMAKDLKILKEQKVSKLKPLDKSWHLETEEGLILESKNVILTAPLPQALDLLSQNDLAPKENHELYAINYTKALILLAILESTENFSSQIFEGHHFQFMKERQLHPEGLVIQCSPEFSEKYFDQPEAVSTDEILKIFKRSPLGNLKIEKLELKKWRYSRPIATYSQKFLELHPGLYLCGDGFGLPLESSKALINHLL
jgi:renalase